MDIEVLHFIDCFLQLQEASGKVWNRRDNSTNMPKIADVRMEGPTAIIENFGPRRFGDTTYYRLFLYTL